MKKCLIILTRKYPYAFGEPFLESEIDKHIKYYDKILILAQDVSVNEKATRFLPESIEYYATATGTRNKMRMRDVLHTPGKFFFSDAIIQDEIKGRKLTILQRMFLSYFKSRCDRLFKEAVMKCKNIDFSGYDQITIYSYWLFANAMVAVDFKNYLKNVCNYKGRIILLSRAHRYDIYEESNKLDYLPCRNYLLSEFDYVYPCSENGTLYIKERMQNTKAGVQTAYLGTRDYGLSPEKCDGYFHIVSCSRVVKVKGIERMIDDFALLNSESEKIVWTHIGGGVEGKTGYFEKIKQYAEHKLKNISFEFKGALANTEVYEYYKNNSVDVFVNCSYSEGLPVSLMEAISFGIPVIATDVGGSREIIDQEKNGFLLPQDFKKGQLSQKIEIMLKESSDEKQIRRNEARKLWEKCYCAEKNYTDFAKMIAEI